MRAFELNALAITHAFVFVVTTHTVVLQITVLLGGGGSGGETDSKDLFVFLFDFTLS